jgi:hypothetical protein
MPDPTKQRQKLDRYLESQGLLNYQTKGLSTQDIQTRYASAGISVNQNWAQQNYGDRAPQPTAYDPRYQAQKSSGPYLPPQQPNQLTPSQQGTQPRTPPRGPEFRQPPGLMVSVDKSGTQGVDTHALYNQIDARLGATVQDAINGKANWQDVNINQRQQILKDPKFYETNQITNYPTWMQQQIIADPSFDWTRLPKWQKVYYQASSNPAVAGAVQGLVLGAGNPGGAVVGGALGWAAGKSGYDFTKEAWEQKTVTAKAFGWMNWAAEQAEKAAGLGVQAIGAAQDPTTTLKDVFTKEAWNAGAVTFEALAPAIQAATKGDGKLTSRDLLGILPVVNTLAMLGEMVINPDKFKGAEQVLGGALPVELQQNFQERITEARERIAAGEDYRQVMADFQVGVIGQLGDMAGQGFADPLNVMPKVETRVLGNIAEAGGHKVAAEAFRQSGAPLEARSRYKTFITSNMATTIDPAFRVDQMSAFSKWAAGLTETGAIKAGPLSKKGILDKPSKTRWLEEMGTMTPEARAQIGANLFYENIGTLLSQFEDPREAGKYLVALANNDMETWAQLGSQFAGSPEFYTVLPALKDFNSKQLDGIMGSWTATEPNRGTLLRLADILAEDPGKLLEDLAKRGTAEQDFARIVEKLKASQSPQAKVLLGEIGAGRFTVDTLKGVVKVFSGESAQPWHIGQWQAQMLDALGKHFDEWAVKHFDLKPDSGFFRMAHLAKSAQSILLLGMSPGYAITNGLSNMVHRAATGIYGYLTPNQINGWMDRFGVKPARFEEGYGIGGMIDQVDDRSAVQHQAQRKAKRGKGGLQTAQDTVTAISKKLPFNKLSSWFERQEGRQGFAIAMRDFWARSWRRGVGFKTMPPELTRALGDAGIDPGYIYAAIESGMNQGEIERALFGKQQGMQARALVHDAAAKIGISATEAATMLEKVGILDALDGYLSGATTRDRLNHAFDRAMQRAADEIDRQAAEDVIARAQHINQRVQVEGAKALTDIITDVEMQGIEKWLQHYERMGEAAAALDIADPEARNNIWEQKYRESNQEFRRFNAQRGSTYLGILKAVGLGDNQHARDWLANLADIDATMDDAYQFMRRERNGHFEKWKNDWDNPDQYTQRDAVENRIDRKFKAAMKTEDINLRKMGDLLGKQYEQLFGDVAGEAARQAWEKIVAFRKEMVRRQTDFRQQQKQARAAGVPLEQRQAAAREFWQKTYKYMIVHMAQLKQDAIADLDRITRGGGDQTPAPPTGPEPAGPAPQTAEEINALRQAAEARRQAERAAVDAIQSVIEQYSKMHPGDSGNYTRANFIDNKMMLSTIKNAEYGGDPSITNWADAAAKLTPEQVQQIMETRKGIKEQALAAAEAERAARIASVRESAAERASKRKTPENTTLLHAIRKEGGIDWGAVADVTGEKNAKGWPPGVFSKTGARRWPIDTMATILATEWQFPIDLNDVNDPGGVNQLIDLMKKARAGDEIFPTTHDYSQRLAADEAEMLAVSEEAAEAEARAAEQVEAETWTGNVEQAVRDGDLTALIVQLETIPEGSRTDGESHADWASRMFDEVTQRQQQEAQDLAIAENITRAQVAVEEIQQVADIAMTRELLQEKYQEAFPKAKPNEIADWMEISDAALETIGGILGKSREEMYAYYRDVLRGQLGTESLMQVAPPVETPAFRQWFGNSKAIDETGSPMVLYHGTKQDFTQFEHLFHANSTGRFGKAYYFTPDPNFAGNYALKETGGKWSTSMYSDSILENANVIPAYIAIENPYRARFDQNLADSGGKTSEQVTRELQAQGYDGVFIYDKAGQLVEIAAFEPTQIKSTFNQGTFDPSNPNMLLQSGGLNQPAKGGVDFIDGQAIIHATEGGDISTIVHENAHVFLQMLRDAGPRTGDLSLIDDLASFNDWVRLEKFGTTWTAVNGRAQHTIKQYGDTYIYKSPAGYSREFSSFDDARYVLEQEMFARGFERYLAEGKAPTPKLARVFENFKKWLVKIYRKITGSVIDVNMTDEMRSFYAKLLGGEFQAEEALFGALKAEEQSFDIPDIISNDRVKPTDEAIITSPPPAEPRVRSTYEPLDPTIQKAINVRKAQILLDGDAGPDGRPWYQTPELRIRLTEEVERLRAELATEAPEAFAPPPAETITPPTTETQAAMFQTEDLPLFSQTPVPVVEQTFAPQPEIRQESFIETRPEFGQKLEENVVKVKQMSEPTTLKEMDTFEYQGRRYQVTEITDSSVHAQDLTGAYPIGRVWDREQFTKTGFKLAEDLQKDLVPEPPTTTPPASREKNLLDALVDRVSRGAWFAKSRDFESYIKTLGFDLENETDLNLAYDIMEGAYNIRARAIRADWVPDLPILERLQSMEQLEQSLTEARRTLGKMKLQQFSTPLTISEAAGYVADVRPGDIVGEVTAGTANLVDMFHDRPGVEVRVNEIDPGRQEVLRLIGYEPTGLNLMAAEWVLEGGKKAGPFATVQISNPPWGSYGTGKYGKATNVPVKLNDWSQRFAYLSLQRLPEGGRYVGVMPTNWVYTHERSTGTNKVKASEFYKWLGKEYTIQAVIESPPGAYKQRGTDVSSLLVVIDKTPPGADHFGPAVTRYGDTQPKTWDEYASLLDRVPKRTEGDAIHATEQFKSRPAGPDESGIVDPAARRGEPAADIDNIGRPAETPIQRTPRAERTPGPGEEPNAPLPNQRDAGDVTQPRESADAGLVDVESAGIPEDTEQFSYSAEFQERLIAGRTAVKDSGSFTEYVGRAPLQQSDVIHPHPNTVVETKGLAGVPYPPLEEAYRPSPSVMRAMKNRVLSYDGNLDPTWAAIQMNDKHKMGMLIADDVGMGKSRTAAAFVLDRIEKGKKKILVVTKDQQNVLNLMQQEFPQVYAGTANENGAFVGPVPTDYPAQRIHLSGENFPKVKKNEEPIPTFDGPAVYFVTSSEFMHFTEQLKALGPDVVVVDEAHLFKNVGNTARGVSWVELHKDWIARDVNMLYLTATPGVDLSDLQYLYGLRVWSMDGFGDWIKVITGQESPEKMKQRQQATAVAEQWVERVQAARESIDAEEITIQGNYGEEWMGLRVGEIEIRKSTEKWNSGKYYYDLRGKSNTFAATNEMEAVIVANMVNQKLAGMPESLTYSDIGSLFEDATNAFVETFTPPDREVIRSLGTADIKEASDILKQAEKKKWGKSKGVGAFDSTLPPAHTEQIMRELKVTGSYMARDISRAGVDFDTLEYVPPAKAKASFNKRVDVYRRIYDAWRKFGKMNEGPKKMAAMFGVNGDIQADAKRALFNMRLPGVIAEADAAIARGEQAVISVVSVSEVDGEGGSLNSALNKINTKSVEKVGKDEYSDPLDIPEAILEVNDLKEELNRLDVLPSPIDILREKYGDRIAFVTGATSTKDRIRAQRDFQANKLDVIVISGAGKTGINLHDVTGKKRIALIVGDYEWSATNFKQELGRVDRTGQRSSPKVRVMHTGSAAERKFVATISNRMKGLGATSKGGSESTGTGAMTDVFELGSEMDKVALAAMWQDLPADQKAMFLDGYFEDKNIAGAEERIMRSTIDMKSEAISKVLLGLQSMYLEDANAIMETFTAKIEELKAGGTNVEDRDAIKTAANTGQILRSVDLGDNLRLSEVVNAEGQKFAVLDGVLTPHMNTVKGIIAGGKASWEEQMAGAGNAWMRWTQFYDPEKNTYVTGLRVNTGKIKDVAERFGKAIASAHKPETAMVDLRAGDRIKISGANASEWELYMGRGGAREDKIVIDNARLKDKDALMKNGAAYNATGNFFYVPEANVDQFLKRFPIRNEETANPPTLYQDNPITPDAQSEMPLGGYEQAAGWLPESEVKDEGWTHQVRPLLDAMRETATERLNTKPLEGAVRDMSPEGQAMLSRYMNEKKGEMATTKLATMRWGENQRDSAMFNYNRTYGFDKFLQVPYPYEFFYTRAMMKWLTMAVDGPAWYSNYARMKMQQQRYEKDIPERLRNKIKIPAPWLPKWMGDGLYIDPMTNLFFPANVLRPFERMQQDRNYQQIEAERILQEWAADGTTSESEIVQAAKTKTGPLWERAFAEAQMRREAEISNPADFFASMFGPAWWLSTPLNLAGIKVPGISKGDRSKVSSTPMLNTSRALDTVTQGTWAEPVGDLIGLLGKPEEWARNKAGLPALGEYGEYYTKRQIANMVTEGLLDSEQAQLAMLEKKGPVWDQATERVKMELAMRVPLAGATYAATHEGPGAAAQAILPSLFGAGLLPAGELEYRGLKDEWNNAWKRYDTGDPKAITAFFDDHPEYEAYLAKGKDEGELLQSFLVGQIWDGYMAMGPTDKKTAVSQMGTLFEQAFLDKETRSYESIPTETLVQWARMFGGQAPETPATQQTLAQPAPELNMYPQDMTKVTDQYFQTRKEVFPNYFEQQQEYYNLPRSKQPRYLIEHPEYAEYRKWQKGWYKKYPELVPVFNGQVFKKLDTSTWPAGLDQYVTVYAMTGQPLPKGATKALEMIWIREGRPMGDFKSWLKAEVAPAMLYAQPEQSAGQGGYEQPMPVMQP